MKVAVYGTLKYGYSNNRYLEEAQCIGSTIIDGFEMYSHSSWMYPYVTPGIGTISAEVYEIDNLERLDWLEGYPEFYDRKLISTKYGDAWIYFMHDMDKPSDIKIEVW